MGRGLGHFRHEPHENSGTELADVDADAVALETVERRKHIKREGRAFIAQLKACSDRVSLPSLAYLKPQLSGACADDRNGIRACAPSRAIILRNHAVVTGPPRSETKTWGPGGFSRCSRRSARNSLLLR